MCTVLDNRLGGPRLSRNSVVWLTDRSDMTIDVYRHGGCKANTQLKQQQQQQPINNCVIILSTMSVLFK